MNPDHILKIGREVVELEAASLATGAARLGESFVRAVEKLSFCPGVHLVVCGLGKSGHIGRKIAATFSSTGTPAYFLHPSEALHGDLGILRDEDVVLAIAYGGETQEVLEVARYTRRLGLFLIAITGKLDSTLAKLADAVLDASVMREACPHELAPTSSSTLSLALGDALAMAVMQAKGFGPKDFANIHPGGSLGRKLQRVHEKMMGIQDLFPVGPEASFAELVHALNRGGVGHLPVIESASGKLLGCFTDGDLRRTLLRHANSIADLANMKAANLMRPNPLTISDQDVVANALNIMEKRQISGLFVTQGADQQLCGFLHLKDLIANKVV